MRFSGARANVEKRHAAGLSSTRGQISLSKNRAEQGKYHLCTSCKRRTGVAEVRFTTEAQRHGEERKIQRGVRGDFAEDAVDIAREARRRSSGQSGKELRADARERVPASTAHPPRPLRQIFLLGASAPLW
jgi:hypothetical protein